MATDGVKIIDGDLAHDTYEYIMELYDSGASAEIINLKSATIIQYTIKGRFMNR